MHTFRHIACLVVLAVCSNIAIATDDPSPPANQSPVPTPLDRFKALEGTWDADITGDGETDTQVSYQVIAAGSVVAETLFGGTHEEMLTMYHMDGPRLICTHYCAAGNQPRLEAKSITDKETGFAMFDATDLATPEAMHMNSVTFTFIDVDHVTSRWSSKANGQESEHATFKMSRQNTGQNTGHNTGHNTVQSTDSKNAAGVAPEPEKDGLPTPSKPSNFVILMYEDDNLFATLPEARQAELMAKYIAWVGDLQSRGIFQSGTPCGSEQVLLTASGSAITAKPYAPKKDVLTGLFIIRATSLDKAVEIAQTCPALTHGERIVVRPASHE